MPATRRRLPTPTTSYKQLPAYCFAHTCDLSKCTFASGKLTCHFQPVYHMLQHVSVNVPKINVQLNNSKSSSYFKSADQSCINESGCFESDESVADSFNSGKTSPHKRFKRKRYQKVGIKKAKQKRLQPILPYKCNHCAGRGFSSLRFLKSHIAVVHHRTMRQHLCHRCGRGFSLKSALVNHMTKRHGKLSIRSRANGKFVKSKS